MFVSLKKHNQAKNPEYKPKKHKGIAQSKTLLTETLQYFDQWVKSNQ